MPRELLEALSTWRGRHDTQSALEARGFLLHKVWQERIKDFCGPGSEVDLARYWDEYAAETVRSAGKCNPNTRQFGPKVNYRSSYLDELAERRDFAEPPFLNPPLLRCLYEYEKKSAIDDSFSMREFEFFELLKEREIIRFSISAEGWTGLKHELIPFATTFGNLRGFRLKGTQIFKESSAGLVFELKIDIGGRPHCGLGLPLHLTVYYAGTNDRFHVALDRIIPGFTWYSNGRSPESKILGVFAHVEAFDILYHSIEL